VSLAATFRQRPARRRSLDPQHAPHVEPAQGRPPNPRRWGAVGWRTTSSGSRIRSLATRPISTPGLRWWAGRDGRGRYGSASSLSSWVERRAPVVNDFPRFDLEGRTALVTGAARGAWQRDRAGARRRRRGSGAPRPGKRRRPRRADRGHGPPGAAPADGRPRPGPGPRGGRRHPWASSAGSTSW
jgi:hypothetical protein